MKIDVARRGAAVCRYCEGFHDLLVGDTLEHTGSKRIGVTLDVWWSSQWVEYLQPRGTPEIP